MRTLLHTGAVGLQISIQIIRGFRADFKRKRRMIESGKLQFDIRTVIDGYFAQRAHHINVNVLNKQKLLEAYENPQKYPNLTIRVSGYAVNFHRLSKEQQKEVISRTFHQAM